jgi:hypothetical protein
VQDIRAARRKDDSLQLIALEVTVKIDTARSWVIWGSLAITATQGAFLLIAPIVGFNLKYPKNLDLLQVVGPVFLGYLGAAAAFIFKDPPPEVPVNEKFLGPLIVGPIAVYVLFVGGALLAFGYSNRESAVVGTGMPVEDLSRALSIALGVLAATTSVISANLFVAPKRTQDQTLPQR